MAAHIHDWKLKEAGKGEGSICDCGYENELPPEELPLHPGMAYAESLYGGHPPAAAPQPASAIKSLSYPASIQKQKQYWSTRIGKHLGAAQLSLVGGNLKAARQDVHEAMLAMDVLSALIAYDTHLQHALHTHG